MGRIKDLTAVSQASAQSEFVIDNDTAVNKISYPELAQQLITNYGGAVLGGTPRPVKTAIDALKTSVDGINTDLSLTTTNVSFTLGTVTYTVTIKKWGKICMMSASLGATTGTPFADVSDNPVIATLPEGYRPAGSAIMYCTALGRTVGGWATADYYPLAIGLIPSSGNVQLFGKSTELKACRFVTFGITYIAA